MTAGRRRGLVLLTEEEASRLADAVNQFHVPRSFLILEAIQAGLHHVNATTIPGRRSRPITFRLPTEITTKIKQAAEHYHVSQQNLIRHLLFTYLTQLTTETRTDQKPAQQTSPTEPNNDEGIRIAA